MTCIFFSINKYVCFLMPYYIKEKCFSYSGKPQCPIILITFGHRQEDGAHSRERFQSHVYWHPEYGLPQISSIIFFSWGRWWCKAVQMVHHTLPLWANFMLIIHLWLWLSIWIRNTLKTLTFWHHRRTWHHGKSMSTYNDIREQVSFPMCHAS